MKQLLVLLTFLLGAALFHSTQAQYIIRGGFQGNQTEATVQVSDKENGDPLVGAVVEVICKADTLRGVTTKRSWAFGPMATWECNKIFRDSVELKVSYLGYKEFKQRFSAERFTSFHNIRMEIDETQIAQVVVTGEHIAMVFRGDTTVYNAGAFKTLSDDRFAELLKQLPGVEIRDNKIFAQGEEVKRVYVDGRNLFGSNASFALSDMEASDVSSVRVYEELSAEARHKGDESIKKDKVMDVETKSKRKVLLGGEVELTGGASFEKDYSGRAERRHSEGATFYRHAESGNIRIMGLNSKDATGIGYENIASKISPAKRSSLSGAYEYRRGDTIQVTTSATLTRDKMSSRNSFLTDYFPTAEYDLRRSESDADSGAKSLSAQINNFSSILSGKNHFTISGVFSINGAERSSESSTTQQIDTETTYTQNSNNSQERNINADIYLSYQRQIKKGSSVDVEVRTNLGNQNRDGWRIDTLASTPGLRMKLNDEGTMRKRMITAGVGYSYKPNKASRLSTSYEFMYNYQKSRQLAIDFLNNPEKGSLDSINTYDYTVNYFANSLVLEYSFTKDKFQLSASVKGAMYNLVRDERLPTPEYSPRSFFQLAPTITISQRKNKNRFYGMLSSSPQMPSAEMLRSTLNATNPLSLQAGNPNLKMPNNLSTSFNYELTKPETARSISFGVGAGYTFNFLTSRSTLFLEERYLEQYNYTAQRGAQLNTQVNVKGNYNLGVSMRYSKQIKSIRSTLNASVRYSYSEIPYFIDSLLNSSVNHSVMIMAGISTGFSTKVKINLNTNTNMRAYTTQNEIAYDLLERLDLRLDLRFGKYFGIISTIYEFYINTRSTMLTRHNVQTNISAGRKFGKENQFALSIGATDIFNRPDNTQTTFRNDYVSTFSTAYLGRYGFIRAAYTF